MSCSEVGLTFEREVSLSHTRRELHPETHLSAAGTGNYDVDVFGQQIYDQHLGLLPEDFREVGERDDGYIRVYDHPSWYFAQFEDWYPHLQKSMKYVRGRTLDIGCGAGRVSLYLQDTGVDLVGIDQSPLAVKVCRERGLRDARVLSVIEISASSLGVFDTIIMTGNNFGIFGNAERTRLLLRQFLDITTNEGRIIAETTDPYATDDPVHLAYQERNRNMGRMSGQYRHREHYRNLKGPWFDWLFVSRDEMRHIVDGTGWTIREFIEPEGAQYVAILEKDAAGGNIP